MRTQFCTDRVIFCQLSPILKKLILIRVYLRSSVAKITTKCANKVTQVCRKLLILRMNIKYSGEPVLDILNL